MACLHRGFPKRVDSTASQPAVMPQVATVMVINPQARLCDWRMRPPIDR